ncbi:amino acid ABC transporter substrate-binding protein, PAAT family [Caminicella sporogenes DSM 14501]|uniref:Amino acid ABC transporter substrate-binding protein, PAAT family n=1 Tax=Caminicella sporogenes DSM 14501 TaxID=1121266 RepID=A0A1M6PB30_9FIRM|nr:transporter substrate-binding domain-containing protein [Caminicella sporogenes]RKD21467.1 amino acid ABC transporter [Caminicella sporogenes]SHK05155.1 amino acid ABC transporter substrate-binding protein, PAAT family [Caminicella sporogenes DSM 14501]
MLKKIGKKFITVLLIGVMLFSFTACQKGVSSENNSDKEVKKVSKLETIKKAGKLVVGTSADYPPYEFHYVNNGKDEIVGFDIAIANEIAKDLGVELEIEDIGFDGLLAALKGDKVDIVIAGMTPTEERKKSVDFSKVYYKAVQSVLVGSKDVDKFKTIDDLTGKVIGVQKGTIQEELAKTQIKDAKIESLTSIADLILQLKNGKVDAVIAEAPVAKAYAKNIDGIEVSSIQLETDDNGSAVAVNKGNEDLVEAINKTLDKLMSENKIEEFVLEAIKLSEENQQ